MHRAQIIEKEVDINALISFVRETLEPKIEILLIQVTYH